ncbi:MULTISPECIES: DinB family protein [unclassified Paenibacillus]|uniref:DinB family protein n=1 Tax=unclassified Paenibacillus TaxID=185978 RepID=UPI001AE7C553|nr:MULTISPECIES: DinB family protein [unclassified Paenibacillus]MBP1154074.1 putative damage-inducible protein DinB [Paenibacillus sp. PvP091]MBP1170541.1 putative damage-inducible protein DinB [Paenibacillus sp. PvR098]MBP2441569.1 putative damage-inducible protein DinB [Paenibacillus sp. PvP052]
MSIQEAIHSIQETIDEIVRVSKVLPEEVIQWKPAEDKWSIIEVLCHVEEATPYWLNEVQALLKSPGIEWGRGLQHEGRLAAVAGASERSTSDVLQGIEKSKAQVQEILSTISEDDLKEESPSRNPRFGTKPLQFIVDHLLVEHLTTHLNQINRNIGQFKEA